MRDFVDGEGDRDAIEAGPRSEQLAGVARYDLDMGRSGEESPGARGERFVDLDRHDGTRRRNHAAREGGAVARTGAELGHAIARTKIEHAKRQEVGVGRADRGKPVVIEQKRRVERAFADVGGTNAST